MCSFRRVLCQNFNPLSLFSKNDLENFDKLTLKKFEIQKYEKKKTFFPIARGGLCQNSSTITFLTESWQEEIRKNANKQVCKLAKETLT